MTARARALLVVVLVVAAAPASAYERARDADGARFLRRTPDVVAVMADRGVPGVPDGGRAALARALATWAAVPCGAVLVAQAGTTGGVVVEVVVVREGWSAGATLAAVTQVQSGPRGVVERATIRLNAAHRFSDGTAPEDDAIDLETLFVHELGHALGLAHAFPRASVMHAGVRPGVVRRALAEDDVRGACATLVPRR